MVLPDAAGNNVPSHGVVRHFQRRQEIAVRAITQPGVFWYHRRYYDGSRCNPVRFEAQGKDGASPGPGADNLQISRGKASVSGKRVDYGHGKAAAYPKWKPLEGIQKITAV